MYDKKKRWEDVLNEKFQSAKDTFNKEYEAAESTEQQLYAYARYTGKIEALIEGLIY